MQIDEDIRAALRASHFGSLPDNLILRLLGNASCYEVPTGTELAPPGRYRGPKLFLIVQGLAKLYLVSPSGRQVTIRYTRVGALIGSPSLFDPPAPGAAVRTLTATRVVALDGATVVHLAETDVRVAHALNVEMAQRVHAYFDELAGTTFGTLRERVARHLLDVASEQQRGPKLVAYLTQQELADAVGSAREVVGRTLGKMRQEGLVRTRTGEIELLDPARLAFEVPGRVTEVAAARDRGR